MADKTEQEQRETVRSLIKDARIAMLTTMTSDGRSNEAARLSGQVAHWSRH